MINVGFWSYYEDQCLNNQKLINPNLGPTENATRKFCDLYKIAKNEGINFMSLDVIKEWDQIDCFFFADFPRLKNRLVQKAFATKKPMFLLTDECEAVYPDNWKLDNHKLFDKIFTWRDGFINNKKYFKTNFYFIETKEINKDLSKKEKLCVLIAGNKVSSHPLELYSKRKEAVRWFERYHPEDFDLEKILAGD